MTDFTDRTAAMVARCQHEYRWQIRWIKDTCAETRTVLAEGILVDDGTEGDTGTQCGHDPQGIVGPMYLFPPAKPAPPTSRETLAANVERLRICKFWSIRDLATRAAEIGGMGIEHWIWSIEALDDESLEDPSFRIAGLDALAAAFDTSPAALLTPQETQA